MAVYIIHPWAWSQFVFSQSIIDTYLITCTIWLLDSCTCIVIMLYDRIRANDVPQSPHDYIVTWKYFLHKRPGNAELLCFLYCSPEHAVEKIVDLSVICDAKTFMWYVFLVQTERWWTHAASWSAGHWKPLVQQEASVRIIMTSSNGNFSALLALCAENSPVTGEFTTQRPVTRSFDVFFDRRLNNRLSKQSWGRWFETPSCSLWRHYNVMAARDLQRYYQIETANVREETTVTVLKGNA